jgi:protocatechuate 3,4-dioxygenase beta subunit
MNRRIAVVAVVIAAVLAIALVFLKRRGGESEPAGDGAQAAPPVADTQTGGSTGDEQVRFDPRVFEEDDPDGSLRLEGQVVDRDDHGVGGAEVVVGSRPPRTTTTEGDGTFHFDKLIAREYGLTATAGDLAGTAQVDLTADSDPVIIRMREGAAVEITVVDAGTNKPLAGAAVAMRSLRDVAETTDSDGIARFRGVAPGFAIAHASAEGHAPAESLVQIPEATAEPIRQTIALSGGAPVAGRVVDTTGAPVEGARVVARDAGELWSLSNPEIDGAPTNAKGEFRIPAVAGGTFRFTAHHDEFPTASSDPITLDGTSERTGIVIQMEAGVTVRGKVVTAGGAPAKWATVRIGPKVFTPWSGGWEGVRSATADEAGAFEFKALRREPVMLMASSADASSDTLELDLAARGSVDDALLRLTVEGVIAGVVVDGNGEPVAEAQVSAWPDILSGGDSTADWAVRGSHAAVTDGAGHFEFRGIPDGTFRVRANRSAATQLDIFGMTTGVKAKTGDTDVRIVLEPEGGLRGKLAHADGDPIELFSVGIGFTAPRPGGKGGAFEVNGLPGGRYDVTFRGPTFSDKTLRDVEVKGGQVVDLGTIEVESGRAVSGRVVDANGRPVKDAQVITGRQLFSDGSKLGGSFGTLMDGQMGIRRATTDARGEYRIIGIGKREAAIGAEHPELGRSQMTTLPAGADDARIDLPLIAFGGLRGKVTLAGEPAGKATVMAAAKGSQSPIMVNADDKGDYIVSKLPAGDYSVTAMVQTGGIGSARTQSAAVTVKPGAAAVADIDVKEGEITLVVKIEGKDGAVIDFAQVFLADGKWNLSTVKELNLAFFGGGGSARVEIANDGKQAAFDNVVPGAYSACIIPISGDMSDQTFQNRLQEFQDQIEVHCKSVIVRGAPAEQTFIAVVPPMKPLPESSE